MTGHALYFRNGDLGMVHGIVLTPNLSTQAGNPGRRRVAQGRASPHSVTEKGQSPLLMAAEQARLGEMISEDHLTATSIPGEFLGSKEKNLQ